MIQEKDILSCDKGQVTFRYQNSQTKQTETRTLSGVAFLRLILQHILPKGYRRARNFGFLHPNSKLVQLEQLLKRVVIPPLKPRPTIRCKCCGGIMKIVRTRLKSVFAQQFASGNFGQGVNGTETPSSTAWAIKSPFLTMGP